MRGPGQDDSSQSSDAVAVINACFLERCVRRAASNGRGELLGEVPHLTGLCLAPRSRRCHLSNSGPCQVRATRCFARVGLTTVAWMIAGGYRVDADGTTTTKAELILGEGPGARSRGLCHVDCTHQTS